VHTCRWKEVWVGREVKEAARGDGRQDGIGERYRTSPNEVTSRSMVDPFRRKDFACDVVVTPFDEVL
jgi:hypothetical protein